jgi:phage regulator Rha-like protein
METHQNKPCTTSRLVVAKFDKRQDNVLRDIEKIECNKEFSLLNFEESFLS